MSFTVSHLSYQRRSKRQCQAVVKVPGSFRPAAANEHLYSYFNFAGSVVETVGKSLRHSCRSELHLIPLFPVGQTMPSSRLLKMPAYCASRRFAAFTAVTDADPWEGQSLRGHTVAEAPAEGFPRHHPPSVASPCTRQPVWASPL